MNNQPAYGALLSHFAMKNKNGYKKENKKAGGAAAPNKLLCQAGTTGEMASFQAQCAQVTTPYAAGVQRYRVGYIGLPLKRCPVAK